VNMHRDGFFITGESWSKFNATFPSVTSMNSGILNFARTKNAMPLRKKFFADFQSDPIPQARILAEHHLRREAHRAQRCP
jgi:hypothetical protein